MIQFPNWRSIGRDIGKKLRDIMNPNPVDTGPSKQERKFQRLRDMLNGFAYFDTFEEALNWNSKAVDPLQQANTPLVARVEGGHLEQKSKLILCHDYKGGYHDYEGVRPEAVEEELYSCAHLQYLDWFIYFSHKLVCVPPPTWTNLCHRNGVKVLGTFIVEPQTPNVECIFTKSNGRYSLADKLAEMAYIFGFDGWLLNIEKKFAANSTTEMVEFIQQLKNQLDSGSQVIWYDALNSDNEVKYQDGLTKKNLPFAKAADALFTNYKWTEGKLQEANDLAAEHGLELVKLYFGVDVWAQNTNMPGPPRVTWPPNNGGGTNTGLAMKLLKENGYSTAIFGPAWTYEHFSTGTSADTSHSMAKAVDESLWEGATLPEDLGCDCTKGRPHHTAHYQLNSISEHSSEHAAGSPTYLHTEFAQPFTPLGWQHHRYLSSGSSSQSSKPQQLLYPTLGMQGILPHLLPMPLPQWEKSRQQQPQRVLYGEYCKSSKNLLTIHTKILGIQLLSEYEQAQLVFQSGSAPERPLNFRLFKLSMPMNIPLTAQIWHSRELGSTYAEVGVYVIIQSLSTKDVHHVYHSLPYKPNKEFMTEACINLVKQDQDSHLVEIGVYYRGKLDSPKPLQLLAVSRLSILPTTVVNAASPDFEIKDLRIVERGESPHAHKRLVWDIHSSEDGWPQTIPWSNITGPFSHFTVLINGRELGQSYCKEFPLKEEDLRTVGGEVVVNVLGTCFGNLRLLKPAVASLILNRVESQECTR